MFSNFAFSSFLFECFSCNQKANVKISKRKISMDIGVVMNDINTWLVDEDNYSMEDDLNQLVGESDDEDEDMK